MARRQPPAAPPNLLERAIGAVSPQWALKRHQARTAMVMTGGYAGAGYSERLVNWQPGVGDADANTVRDLRELRARSRDLVRNSPIAGGAIETTVTNVVGRGLALQSHVDSELLGLDDDEAAEWQRNVERRFALWAKSELSDAMAELNFAEQQDLALRSWMESGDTAVILTQRKRPGWPYTLALQIVEADRICNPDFRANNQQYVSGFERDDTGASVAVHIVNFHPGTALPHAAFKWARIELRGAKTGRRNVLILKRKKRPGQTRGIPELAPIIGTLKQLDRYADAEIDAAVNSAAMAIFTKMDPDSFQELFEPADQQRIIDSAHSWDGNLRSGSAINLLPGEDVTMPNPGRPNPNFDPFMTAFMRFVGIGLNIPHEVLAKHFQSSYSAARAALLDAWRTFMVRRQRLADKLCQPVYEEWLADEVANGRIAAPGFFADPLIRSAWCGAAWTGDGPGSLDPLKEVKAARERIDAGITTLQGETLAYDGSDWEANHRQRARELDERIEAGLQAPISAGGVAADGEPLDAPGRAAKPGTVVPPAPIEPDPEGPDDEELPD